MGIANRGKIALLATTAMVVAVSAARAADGIETVVVTAEKREQELFKVPMSVSAVTGAEISQRGAQDVKDLQYTVPGLSINELAPGTNRVELRGVSVFSGLPTVGTYLDELPLNGETAQTGLDVRLLDLERVEVLRGPQGTLYGQGAMGGTIRYITRSPNLEEFSASAGGEVSTIADGGTDWSVQGVVNVPIATDTFGIRVAGSHQEYGGWIDNPVLGQKDINDGSSNALRAKALWTPNDDLQISLLYLHQDLQLHAQNLGDADRQTTSAVLTPASSRADMADLTITYNLGFATLLSSSGVVDRKDFYQYDLSSLFIPALEAPLPFGFGYPSGTFASIAYDNTTKDSIFAQETRLTSNGDGPFAWTIGGMYRKSDTGTLTGTINTPDIVPVDLLSSHGTSPSNSRSWSVFGEASWQFTPEWKATVGGRYFEDERIQNVSSVTFGAPTTDINRATFSSFSPRFNLAWTPDDNWSLYANVAKGFRSGGFNLVSAGFGVVPVPPTYGPDVLWSYEAGGRYRSSDRSIELELAVYYNDWTKVQSLEFATGFPIQYVVNSSDIAGAGVDAAINWRPTDALTLTLSGGYNDMTYRNTTGEHVAGDRPDYVPQYTMAASANYDFHWAQDLPGFARLDYQVTSGWQVFPRNALPAVVFAEKQDYLNARLGIETGSVSISLFAKNILDENGVSYPAFASLVTPMRPEPRTIGIAITYDH